MLSQRADVLRLGIVSIIRRGKLRIYRSISVGLRHEPQVEMDSDAILRRPPSTQADVRIHTIIVRTVNGLRQQNTPQRLRTGTISASGVCKVG